MKSFLYSLAAVGLLAGPGIALGQAPKKPVTVEEIERVWRARQDATRSLLVEWTERQVFTAGCISADSPPTPGKAVEVIPPKDSELESHKRVLIDGTQLRYEHDNPEWDSGSQSFKRRNYATAFDGQLARSLSDGPACRFPDGLIRPSASDAASNYHLQTILIHYRYPDSKRSFLDLSGYSVTGSISDVDGRDIVSLRKTNGRWESTVRLKAAQGYALCQITESSQGITTSQFDAAFEDRPGLGPVPISWSITILKRDGSVSQAFYATVSRIELNPDLPAGSFTIVFPVGCKVSDYTVRPTREYIIRQNNSVRDIPPEDIMATYEQLVASEPGYALAERPNSINIGYIAAGVALIVTAAFVFALRKRL